MPGTTADYWSNYWQGRAAGKIGEGISGVGIESDGEIFAFWDEALSAFDEDCRFLDMACGAGSVVRSANAKGFTNMTGVDVAAGAVSALKAAYPACVGVVAPAEATGLPDDAFDVIGSQFGFEYAKPTFVVPEIERLLAPGGEFIALAHKTGSEIEREVAGFRDEAQSILETEFVAAAKQLFRADRTTKDQSEFNAAIGQFRPAQDALLLIAKESGGLAEHLYTGTQTLFENSQKYKLEDTLNWLGGMEIEVEAYHGRMQSMIDAALSEEDVTALRKSFESTGMTCEAPSVFCTGFEQDELAWIIHASKAQ